MTYLKKRVPRRGHKDADELLVQTNSLLDWVSRNLTAVLYAAGTLVFILIVVFGFIALNTAKENRASRALAEARAVLNAAPSATGDLLAGVEGVQQGETEEARLARLESALAAFAQVVESYPDRPQGKEAALYSADILYQLGRQQETVQVLVRLMDRDPSFARVFNAVYLLGRSYEALEQYDQAVGTYSQVVDVAAGEMKAIAMMDMARCLVLSGHHDRAADVYRDVEEEFEGTVFANKAGKLLVTLPGQEADGQ